LLGVFNEVLRIGRMDVQFQQLRSFKREVRRGRGVFERSVEMEGSDVIERKGWVEARRWSL
jgi:hypothetical protein